MFFRCFVCDEYYVPAGAEVSVKITEQRQEGVVNVTIALPVTVILDPLD